MTALVGWMILHRNNSFTLCTYLKPFSTGVADVITGSTYDILLIPASTERDS